MSGKENCQDGEVQSFSESVIHLGVVAGMFDRVSRVEVTGSDGQEYVRCLRTELLEVAGIGEGDRVELTYTKEARPGVIDMCLQIRNFDPAESREEIHRLVPKTRSKNRARKK